VNAFAVRLQPVLMIVGVVWAVEIVNLFTGHSLVALGIQPRSVSGLIGIPLAPLIHGGLWHAISNTLPLVILGGLTLVGGRERFWEVTLGIVAVSGVLVWLLARDAQHVGASGVVFGYFGAIVARAFFERRLISIAIAFATVFIYGSLIWGVLPQPQRSYISFESHLFGLLAGVFIVWLSNKIRRDSRA
jgi:membrane associated rhomboid family serine protease